MNVGGGTTERKTTRENRRNKNAKHVKNEGKERTSLKRERKYW